MFPIRALLLGLALFCAIAVVSLTFKAPTTPRNQVSSHNQGAGLTKQVAEIRKVDNRPPEQDSSPEITASIPPSQVSEPAIPEVDGSVVIEFPTAGNKETAPVRSHKMVHHAVRPNKPAASNPNASFASSQSPGSSHGPGSSQGYKPTYTYKPVPIPEPNSTNRFY